MAELKLCRLAPRSALRILALLSLSLAGGLAQEKIDLQGRVADAAGLPLVGATVFVRDLSTGLETAQRTDSMGAFAVAMRPGKYRISAALADFETASETVEVAGAELAPLALTLFPAILNQSIVVTGSREEVLREDSIAKVEVISRSQLLDSGYEQVTDILSEEPGIVTRTDRSPGSRGGTQIHGLDSRQSLLLLDGFPLVGARGVKSGIVNMNRQSTNRLERVEIVKGASSALYGSDAIGGVINLITREPQRRFDSNVTASGGSLGAVDLRADTGFVRDRLSGFLAVERHKRNLYDLTPQYLDTSGPGFRRYDYMAKLNFDVAETFKIGLLANAFDNQERSVNAAPGREQNSVLNDSAQNYGITLSAGLTQRTQLQARTYYGKYDENSTIDIARVPGPANATANLNERLYRFDASLSHVLGGRQLLQGGVDWTSNEYRGQNRLLGDNDGVSIRMVDVWFQDRIQAHPRLSLTVGGRLTDHSAFGARMVPRVGLLFRAAESVRVKASYGQGFRAPDLGQLYYRYLSTSGVYQIIGNPALSPESSTTTQVGVDGGHGRLRFSATYFWNGIKNLIQTDLLGRPRTQEQLDGIMARFGVNPAFAPSLNSLFYLYRNIENVYTTGAEGSIQLRLTPELVISTAYTYLDARDTETGAFLSQRHKHNGNFRVWWTTERFGGLRTNLRGVYLGKWPIVGRRSTLIADGYQLWDWYLAKPLRKGLELYGSVDNFFDSIDSGLDSPDPSFVRADPGRTFRVGMRWSLGTD